MGADVVKVENPMGEDTRHFEPKVANESTYFLHYNRNKRSITLDTRDANSVDHLKKLIAWADVLVQNYRPGTLTAMGLDDEALAAINPALIVVSISGYGQEGEWSHRPLFNSVAEALSGAMSLNGNHSSGPLMSGTYVADHATGLQAAFAAVTALFERDRTGLGQHVDISLFDSMLSVIGHPLTSAINGKPYTELTGNRDATAPPGNLFATGDSRRIYIDAGSDRLFLALTQAMGSPAHLGDGRFASVAQRWARVDELEHEINVWTLSLDAQSVSDALDREGVPHGVVQTLKEAVQHPLLIERGMLRRVGEGEDAVNVPGVVAKLSRTPGSVRRRPPRLGEHTSEVLREISGQNEDSVGAALGAAR
ncbi:crotonobetainyl-CoA:carnitine CoA-transferase CaiB-like acyl-CoA transferase [Arthrobacter tumbae]|nr:crotonobetainyl-CoA:carnitine CoA-transferase CaiB-like acyl-CoA transferase [Arthrobacter tumbae]